MVFNVSVLSPSQIKAMQQRHFSSVYIKTTATMIREDVPTHDD